MRVSLRVIFWLCFRESDFGRFELPEGLFENLLNKEIKNRGTVRNYSLILNFLIQN